MMNTVLGILAKGDMNCAGEETPEHGDLFGPDKPAKPAAKPVDPHQNPRSASEVGPGVVLTEAEKNKAEEQRRKAPRKPPSAKPRKPRAARRKRRRA